MRAADEKLIIKLYNNQFKVHSTSCTLYIDEPIDYNIPLGNI